jgi:hypothetical protein
MYGYESSATLTTDRLHYKLQTRPLVRDGAPRRRAKQLSGKKKKIWSWAPKGCPIPRRIGRLTVGHIINSYTETAYRRRWKSKRTFLKSPQKWNCSLFRFMIQNRFGRYLWGICFKLIEGFVALEFVRRNYSPIVYESFSVTIWEKGKVVSPLYLWRQGFYVILIITCAEAVTILTLIVPLLWWKVR